MKIVIDGMGGDVAPARIVDGAVLAAKEFAEEGKGHRIIVTGPKDKISEQIRICEGTDLIGKSLEIIHTDEYVTMEDSPSDIVRGKPNSSAHIGLAMVKKKEAEAFIGMGNTGAMMAIGLMGLGRIEGIHRPTIGAFFPSQTGRTLVLDVGAMVDCKPEHLFQFGIMGSVYMESMFGVKNPKVGLLSVGEEDGKGDAVTLEANKLFREKKSFNFIGNVEGRDILKGTADVVVCDGFVGNVVLKFGESIMGFLKCRFKETAKQGLGYKLGLGMTKPILKQAFKGMDYQEHGGVPLLGVNGVQIIGHGSSSPIAILNAVRAARGLVERGTIDAIREKIKLS